MKKYYLSIFFASSIWANVSCPPSKNVSFSDLENILKGLNGLSGYCAFDFHRGETRDSSSLFKERAKDGSGSIYIDVADDISPDVIKRVCECPTPKFNGGNSRDEQKIQAYKDQLLQKSISEVYLDGLRSKLFESLHNSFSLQAYMELAPSRDRSLSAKTFNCSYSSFKESFKNIRNSAGCSSDLFDQRAEFLLGTTSIDEAFDNLTKKFDGLNNKFTLNQENQCLSYEAYLKDAALRNPPNIEVGLSKLGEIGKSSEYLAVQLLVKATAERDVNLLNIDMETIYRDVTFENPSKWINYKNLSSNQKDDEMRNFLFDSNRQVLDDFRNSSSLYLATYNAPIYKVILGDPKLMEEIDRQFLMPFCELNNCASENFLTRLNEFVKGEEDKTKVASALFSKRNLDAFVSGLSSDCDLFNPRESDFSVSQFKNIMCNDSLPLPSASTTRGKLFKKLSSNDPDSFLGFEKIVEDAQSRLCFKDKNGNWRLNNKENEIEKALDLKNQVPGYLENLYEGKSLEMDSVSVRDSLRMGPDSFEEANRIACQERAMNLAFTEMGVENSSSSFGAIEDLTSEMRKERAIEIACRNNETKNEEGVCIAPSDEVLATLVDDLTKEEENLGIVDYMQTATPEEVAAQAQYVADVESGKVSADEPPPFKPRTRQPIIAPDANLSQQIASRLPSAEDLTADVPLISQFTGQEDNSLSTDEDDNRRIGQPKEPAKDKPLIIPTVPPVSTPTHIANLEDNSRSAGEEVRVTTKTDSESISTKKTTSKVTSSGEDKNDSIRQLERQLAGMEQEYESLTRKKASAQQRAERKKLIADLESNLNSEFKQLQNLGGEIQREKRRTRDAYNARSSQDFETSTVTGSNGFYNAMNESMSQSSPQGDMFFGEGDPFDSRIDNLGNRVDDLNSKLDEEKDSVASIENSGSGGKGSERSTGGGGVGSTGATGGGVAGASGTSSNSDSADNVNSTEEAEKSTDEDGKIAKLDEADKLSKGRLPASEGEKKEDELSKISDEEVGSYEEDTVFPHFFILNIVNENIPMAVHALNLYGKTFFTIEEIENDEFIIRKYDLDLNLGKDGLNEDFYNHYRTKLLKKVLLYKRKKLVNPLLEIANLSILSDEYIATKEEAMPFLRKLLERTELLERVEKNR